MELSSETVGQLQRVMRHQLASRRVLPLAALLYLLPAPGCEDDATGAADAASGATVVGTVTLPATSTGKPYGVRVLRMAGVPGAVPVAQATGVTAGGTTLSYSLGGVPAGTYFVLAFVDVDGSGGESSTPGDFAGWYGHSGDGNPPAAPNAVVPVSGTVRFDFSLVTR